ncbi:YDG domain-containing protein [Saccharicrinis sp. FJH2]|uniref:YDG domain-containing protein n=1 Tax=Saccharicrinis sp. FJH65 TaxID=3344659 RepID=UPI0035F46A11
MKKQIPNNMKSIKRFSLIIFLSIVYFTGSIYGQTTYSFDFNTAGLLNQEFTGTGATGNVSQSTNTGMAGSGAISVISTSTNAVFITKQAYAIGGPGSVYEFTAYMKSVWNSGYGGVGFTTDANATYSNYAHPTNSIGISVHGGGYILNSGTQYSTGSWTLSGGAPTDLLNNGSPDDWYKIVYTISQQENSIFDVTVKVWSVYNDYSLVRTGPDATQTYSFTNTTIANASLLHAYFCFGGSRLSDFDDYMITLTNSSIILPGNPVVIGSASESSGDINLTGNVTSENGAPVTEKGFVWSTSISEPTTTDGTKIINETGGSGEFTSQITSPPTGTYYIRAYAINSGGTSYSSTSTVIIASPPPTITSFTPTSGTTGTTVTITGTNFTGTTAVSFGGTNATSFNVVSPTSITAVIASGASGDVSVTTPDGTATLAGFTFLINQSITFDALSTVAYGDAPFAISATGGASGNPVVFSSSDPTVATCTGTNGTTVTIIKAGSCSIFADQAGNNSYNPATQVSQLLTIDKKSLAVTNASVTTKTYDGTTDAAIAGAYLAGVVGSDEVTLENGNTGTFESANAGTGINVTTNMTLSGAASDNYTLEQPSLTGTIETKALTVTDASVTTKTYDGTTDAAIAGASLAGVIGSDEVTLENGSTGTFESANSGTGINVTTNMTLSGAASDNYNLTQPSLTGTIETKALTVTDASVTTKTYDGTTDAAIAGASLAGVIGSDEVTLEDGNTGTFESANAGTGINVATNMTLSGAASDNYTLEQPSLTGTIETKALTVTDASVTTKTYDGTTDAAIAGASLAGVIGSDEVTLENGNTGTFESANAGTGINVTTNMTLSGAASDNYNLEQPSLTGTIVAAELTIEADDKSRKEGEANPEFTMTYTGFVNGETSAVLNTLPTVSCNADISSDAGNYDITVSGGEATNYSFIYVSGTLTVTPATGISEVEAGYMVYPNPAKDFIYFKENVSVNIYNLHGKLVKSAIHENKMNVSDLGKGLYLIKIINSQKQEFITKLMITK